MKGIKETVHKREDVQHGLLRMIWSMVSDEELPAMEKLGEYYGCGYIHIDGDGANYYLQENGIDTRVIRAAQNIGRYLATEDDPCLTFLEILDRAEEGFSTGDCDPFGLMDEHEEYEDEWGDEIDLEDLRPGEQEVELIREIRTCVVKGGGKELPEHLKEVYDMACDVWDGIKSHDAFLKNLPGILYILAEDYFDFPAKGVWESIESGCVGITYSHIPEAGWLIPLFSEKNLPEEVQALFWCLTTLTEGKYGSMGRWIDPLLNPCEDNGDLVYKTPCCEGETAQGEYETYETVGEVFAPLIWQALYPVAEEKYKREEEVPYGRAA